MYKKTNLAAAVVLGLVSFNAAAVDLNGAAAAANTLARETLVAGSSSAVLTTSGGTTWQMNAQTTYALSNNETRNARFDCSNITFDPAQVTVAYSNGSTGAPSVLSGPNGANTAITFSISANADGNTTDTVSVIPSNSATASGGVTLTTLNNANCKFTLYDTPVNAFAGGTAGTIYSTGDKPYLTYASGMAITTNTGTLITSFDDGIPTTPNFSTFRNPAIAPAMFNSPTLGNTGTITFGLVATAYDRFGAAVNQGTVYGNATKVMLDGAVGAPAGNQPAGFSVWLDPMSNCSNGAGSVNMIYNTKTMTFAAAPAAAPYYICYAVTGNNAIPDATWQLNTTTTNGTVSGQKAGGVIKKEGLELQATIANFHPNYVNRIVVSNDLAVAVPYSIRILSDSGNTVTVNSALASGSLPAKASSTIDVGALLTGATVAPRATVIMSVNTDGANGGSIKAMYQITHKANGAVSNAQMVRMDGGIFGVPFPVF